MGAVRTSRRLRQQFEWTIVNWFDGADDAALRVPVGV
jgi:hypothetical protein